jgi:Acetyl xylan esterase (AXE1)
MKIKLVVIFSLLSLCLFAQNKTPEQFGFRLLKTFYKGDSIDILILSQKGDEQKTKPLILFCQGSLPIPLIKTIHNNLYPVFPFQTDGLLKEHHIAIIGSPYIPLIVPADELGEKFTYIEKKTNKAPLDFFKRNYLDYYVNRNIAVISHLQSFTYISREKLVVAGHLQGYTIAAKMASISPKITHLIITSGNPFGQITSMLAEFRKAEKMGDSTNYGEELIDYWQSVVNNNENEDAIYGDTYKSIYDFSTPVIHYLEKLKIPIFICYGTKDLSTPYNDYLRIELLRQRKENFTFKTYLGREHDFWSLKENGEINYNDSGWDKVANDWRSWLLKNR